METHFTSRRHHFMAMCETLKKSHKLRDVTIDPENFLTVVDYNLTWCPLYKCGSSNWVRNVVMLATPALRHKDRSQFDWHSPARDLWYGFQVNIFRGIPRKSQNNSNCPEGSSLNLSK